MKRRALLSVYNKDKILEVATALIKAEFEIVSTGGTARVLRQAGIPVTDVSAITGVKEYPKGLVKTLHPMIHFALLAERDNPEHVERMNVEGILPIDIVIANLYDFSSVAYSESSTEDDLRDLIDIGGPTMIRAGAKNWKSVTVLTSPDDYDGLIRELGRGEVSQAFRDQMLIKAFQHTADYDALIHTTLSKRVINEDVLRISYTNGKQLRYGENPHQTARVFSNPRYNGPNITTAKQLHGKALSFNNYVDGDGALEAILGFAPCTVSVVKHTNPCGLATGNTTREALEHAWEGDPVSAFGSVIATNREVDVEFMEFLNGKFIEIIIAPSFSEDAVAWVKESKKANLRLLAIGDLDIKGKRKVLKYIHGGMLEQDADEVVFEKFESVSKTPFPKEKEMLGYFSYEAIKHVKSNEIVIAREYEKGKYQILSIGAGQPNRVDAIKKLAATKAKENLELEYNRIKSYLGAEVTLEDYISGELSKCVLSSGAFFPFRDSMDEIAKLGIQYVVEPGGSKRDEEVISAADEYGIALVFTGMRHFRH